MAKYIFITFISFIILGCARQDHSPLPIGFNRIEKTRSEYIQFKSPHFIFYASSLAKIDSVYSDNNEKWFNISYPPYNARIYCSYNQITDRTDLVQFLNDSHKLAYSHTLMANGIHQAVYENSKNNTYGIIYDIDGNVATPIQFFLTDSVSNFFRASLYYDTQVDKDSVAPVTQFIKEDIVKMIESFEWK